MICNHDYENAQRISRAKWLCPKCGEDISMIVYMLGELFVDVPDKVETAKRLEKWVKARNEPKIHKS